MPSTIGGHKHRVQLSVVVPLFDERATLDELYARLKTVLNALGRTHEIILVDDGSTDGSPEELERLAALDSCVRPIILARNYGQTAALTAGFDRARGEVILAMDGDLENEPEDIPALLAKLDEGYDIVSGWREHRRDNLWTRRLPSHAANWLMSRLSGVYLHDFGATIKAYRAAILKRISLHGELHRFIPALASAEGARIAEVHVSHRRRPNNRSHYGLSRTWRVMADLLTVRFLLRYATRPLHLFGPTGFLSLALGTAGGLYTLSEKVLWGKAVFIEHGPLLLLSVILIVSGVMLLSVGLLAEIMVRLYFDGRKRRIYRVAGRMERSRPRSITPAA